MKTIYLIGGAFGATKRILLNYVTGNSFRHLRTAYLKKLSWVQHSHKTSTDLSPDLEFVSKESFDATKLEHGSDFLFYEFNGQQYGFSKSQLESELRVRTHIFVVCRVPHLFEHVRSHFKTGVRIVRVWIYHPKKLLEQEFKRVFPGQDAEVGWRMARYAQAWDEFVRDPAGFDPIWYNDDVPQFQKQVDLLLTRYDQHRHEEIEMASGECYRLPKQLLVHANEISMKSKKLGFQKSIFVMIRFGERTVHLRENIRHTIKTSGFTPVFADDPEWAFDRSTINPILVSCLCKYGIAIFDDSYNQDPKTWPFSASVVYELAFMQCLGKLCAILRHESISVAEAPFDLAGEYLQRYGDLRELEKKLRLVIKNFEHQNNAM